MRILIEGNIVGRTPYLHARLEERRLALGNSGPISLVVDTGFAGSVALRQELTDQMGLRMAAETTFLLANGQKVLLPVYLGQVRLGKSSLTFIGNRQCMGDILFWEDRAEIEALTLSRAGVLLGVILEAAADSEVAVTSQSWEPLRELSRQD